MHHFAFCQCASQYGVYIRKSFSICIYFGNICRLYVYLDKNYAYVCVCNFFIGEVLYYYLIKVEARVSLVKKESGLVEKKLTLR